MSEVGHEIVDNTTAQTVDADGTWNTVTNGALTGSSMTVGDDYVIFIYAQVGGSDAGDHIEVRVSEAGVGVLAGSTHLADPLACLATKGYPYWYVTKFTATGNDIELEVKQASNTLHVSRVNMGCINITDLQSYAQYSEDTDGITNPDAGVRTLTTATLEIGNGSDDYLIFNYLQANIDAVGDLIFHSLNIESVERNDQFFATADLNEIYCMGSAAVIKAPAADTTVTVSFMSNDGACDVLRAAICAINLSAFEDAMSDFAVGPVVIEGGTHSLVMTLSKTTDTADARDWAIIGSAYTANAGQAAPSGSVFAFADKASAGEVLSAGDPDTYPHAVASNRRTMVGVFGGVAAVNNAIVLKALMRGRESNEASTTNTAGTTSLAAFTWKMNAALSEALERRVSLLRSLTGFLVRTLARSLAN